MKRGTIVGSLILLLVIVFGIVIDDVVDGQAGARLARFGLFSGEVSTEGGFRVGRGVTPFTAQSNSAGYTVRAGHWNIEATPISTPMPTVTPTPTPNPSIETEEFIYLPVITR